MARPLGEVAQALADAARAEPDNVRALARRARVGYRVARYTATRMEQRGELVVVLAARPRVMGVPDAQRLCLLAERPRAAAADAPADAAGLLALQRVWGEGRAVA